MNISSLEIFSKIHLEVNLQLIHVAYIGMGITLKNKVLVLRQLLILLFVNLYWWTLGARTKNSLEVYKLDSAIPKL